MVSSDTLSTLKDHLNRFLFIDGAGKGIVDLKLDIIGDETITADSDVTDHYVESNIAYQDQISLKPKIFTINGEVGELVWYQKDPYSQAFGQVAQRLEGVISFLPVRIRGFNQLKTKVMKAAQWVDTISNAASKIANLSTSGNNQQQAFMRLVEFRDLRTPIRVQSPWGILDSYVITNLKFTQPKETKDKTLISITLKEFRTTSISTVKYDADKYQRNAALENQPKVDNGKTSGTDASLNKTIETTPEGEEYEQCRVVANDEIFNIEYSEKYGFSVQNAETYEYLTHDSADYQAAVSQATAECDNIIGALK